MKEFADHGYPGADVRVYDTAKLIGIINPFPALVAQEKGLQLHVLARLVHVDVVDRRANEDSQEEVSLELDAVVAVKAEVPENLSPEFTTEPLDVRRLSLLGVRRRQLGGLLGVARVLDGSEVLRDDAVEVPHLAFSQPVPELSGIQIIGHVRLAFAGQPEVEVHAEELQRVEFAREVLMFLDGSEEVPQREPANRAGATPSTQWMAA